MEKADKKKESLVVKQGRPVKGALSSYPQEIVTLIKKLREAHEGWGAMVIRIELIEEYAYQEKNLPSIDSINRYLKQNGFIKEKEPINKMPCEPVRPAVNRTHERWELDAHGTIYVAGIGYVSMINIKDTKSKVHCMAFPAQTKGKMSQPKTIHYFWALRLAFEDKGLPRAIQVDKDSVFIDNKSKSPFPSLMHLFLIGLGIKLIFIKVSPPAKQAIVERSHQTIDRQVTQGQRYTNWKELFRYTTKRRNRMNEKIPNRLLGRKPPLVRYPQAKHSGRFYQVEKEAELIDMKRIFSYLSKCLWYRKVSKDKTISLDAKIYYIKNATPGSQIQITFCNRRKKLLFRDAKELILAIRPIKDFSINYIMGGTAKDLISTKKKLLRKRDFLFLT